MWDRLVLDSGAVGPYSAIRSIRKAGGHCGVQSICSSCRIRQVVGGRIQCPTSLAEAFRVFVDLMALHVTEIPGPISCGCSAGPQFVLNSAKTQLLESIQILNP